ncbi:TetR/AcrR family transcriptional regulator [Sphingomonas sp. KR3-1]|uniref:TetR/AcrR family transcriptional regulator n=1 Tax=Sphingomonas sp. KR3-1 TaxID=3156611 RepID=UPI0032B5C33A
MSKVRTRMAPDERRAVILAAAAAMFQERGYAASSIDAIAAASGISGPAIYRYFARKTELLVALLEGAAASAMTEIEQATAQAPADGQLAAMADALLRHGRREGAVIGLLQSTVAEMDAADRGRLEAIRLHLVAQLAGLLGAARPELAAGEVRIHVEAALGVIGQLARRPEQEHTARFHRLLLAVLAA